MDRLRELVAGIEQFDSFANADRLRLFAWALHEDGRQHLKAADFGACFDWLHLAKPANIHRAVQALEEQGDLLRSSHGYRLSKAVRDQHDSRYGQRPSAVKVQALLSALPAQLSAPSQVAYLDEAIRCFRAEAWRATAIMAWNLAFDHVCELVASRKLVEFNAGFAQAFPKRAYTVRNREDLREMKESEVIRVCRVADIVDKTQAKCLERNLGIRNDVAHPSGAHFSQVQAEAFVLDVIQTVVLGLA